jgi:dUTP pyrophosphatase
MNKVKVFKLGTGGKLPTRNKTTDAGLDLYAAEDMFILVGSTGKVKTDIAIEIPEGYMGKIYDRSGMAVKGFILGAGVIDCGYSGDCTIILHNFSARNSIGGYQINKGDKIAQMVISKIETPLVVQTDKLWTSERGDSGFGSSGS